MENFKIVDTDTDVSPLMGLIAVECAHPLPVSIAFDFYLFDGCESYAFLTPSVRGFRRAVFSRSKKSIFAESFSYCPEASEGSKAYSEFALKWVLPPWDFCQNITLNVDSDRQIYIFGGK